MISSIPFSKVSNLAPLTSAVVPLETNGKAHSLRHALQSLTHYVYVKIYSNMYIITTYIYVITTYIYIYVCMYTYLKTNVYVYYIKSNRGNEVKQMLTATGIVCTKLAWQVKQLEIN